jgi:hypothetical protein
LLRKRVINIDDIFFIGTDSSAMNAHILDETYERWIDLMDSDEEE